MDTSLDGKYPLRGRTHCGDTDGTKQLQQRSWDVPTAGDLTDSSMESQVQHGATYVAPTQSNGIQRYLQSYRNDLDMNWLESIRSIQITSVIKESVCEATKL